MTFILNPEIAAGLAAVNDRVGEIDPMPVGDIAMRRAVYDPLQRALFEQLPVVDDVLTKNIKVSTEDGSQILLRWYEKRGSRPGSAVLYIPGGGMICSGVDIYDRPVSHYVSATGVPFLSVDYRRAPEFPAPTPVTDSYAGLRWLFDNVESLGVDAKRVAIMGDSGGGGIAASLATYARDQRSPAVARQILIYPMLDDRNTVADPEIAPFAVWTYDDNITGWSALLGKEAGGPSVSPYGAAARLENFDGLPPAYVEVGELDIFRDESINYAQRLLAAGVSTELHVHPGATHAFESFVPGAELSVRSAADRHRVLRSL